MVILNLLNNSLIKVEDATNAHTFFGLDLAGVRGKTVRHKLDRVENDLTKTTIFFHELQKFAILTADVMFVNGIEFLTAL